MSFASLRVPSLVLLEARLIGNPKEGSTHVPVTTVADLTPDVDVEQASIHLQMLHNNSSGGFASLVLLGQQRREMHAFMQVDQLMVPTDDEAGAREALQETVNARWNVYTTCSIFKEVPEKGRGTRADVESVPGVWADLDVKPGQDGAFQTEEELCAFVATLPNPTLEVASGSGGRHLYWLTHERVAPDDASTMLDWWYDFLVVEAQGRAIDKVQETARILRLAGTVRWPKLEELEVGPKPVTICQIGPRWHADELRLQASEAHKHQHELRQTARAERDRWITKDRQAMEAGGMSLLVYEAAVRRFNVLQDWAPLLAEDGWTLHSDVRDTVSRCRYWTRPGKKPEDGKSASTDYVFPDGTPSHTMTLYSSDPTLIELRENVGSVDLAVCSKYHFALTRLYGKDQARLLEAIASGGGTIL